MSILLVGNGTTLLEKLKGLIPGREIVRAWDDMDGLSPEDYSLIILSGGSRFPVIGNESALFAEMSFVQRASVPIVGICYGCEVIVRSSGGELEHMTQREKGIITITIEERDPIFGEKESVEVYENHEWKIKSLSAEYIPLARSVHGIEAIKHRERPIYGFQFHPEHFVRETDGDEIFLRLFKKFIG